MTKTLALQVFEHEKISPGFKREGVHFTPGDLAALQTFYGNDCPYYSLTYNGVKFCEYVGVLKIGNCTIEILPKVEREDEATGSWHRFLIHMLVRAGIFDVAHTGFAKLALRSNNILDLYMILFLEEIKWLIRTGLIKKYRVKDGNSFALKGSLKFSENIKHNLTHAERFYVRYTSYDRIHIWHTLLFLTTQLIAKISTNLSVATTAKSVLLDLPECGPINVTDVLFDQLVYSRKTEPYRKAIQMAKLLLLNYHPDIRKGRNDVLALLFNMNELWEKYVFRMLRSTLSKQFPREYEVKEQVRTEFWIPEGGHTRLVKPDIIIRKVSSGETIAVLDTKWKHLTNNRPDDADLKQMLVYNLYKGTAKSALVYPSITAKDEIKGSYKIEEHGNCSLLFLELEDDVATGKKLNISKLVEFLRR
jgi:5-methylcytosine-specific restriction enzyme subunit McrC